MVQREVDHLKWAGAVNALLTDASVTELAVQTDPRQCGFGKWYYGEGRQHAEHLVPELKPALAEIEEPHIQLHESAVEIGAIFRQADLSLPKFLAEKETDHYKWVNQLLALFGMNLERLDVQTDDHRCGLGRFLHGEEGRQLATADLELGRLLEAVKAPHERLHNSAIDIGTVWRQRHEGLSELLKDRLDDHRVWVQRVSDAILNHESRVGVETNPTKCAFGRFLASEEAQAVAARFPEFQQALAAVEAPHRELHASAVAIEQALAQGSASRARDLYRDQSRPALEQIAEHFGKAIRAEEEIEQAQDTARELFETETLEALRDTQRAMAELKERAVQRVGGMEQANGIYAARTVPALRQVQELLG
jgi:methyl-accepting chemotaxis protein